LPPIKVVRMARAPVQRGVSAGTKRLAPPAPPKKPAGGGLFGTRRTAPPPPAPKGGGLFGTRRVAPPAPAPKGGGTFKVRTSAPAAVSAGTRAVRSGASPARPAPRAALRSAAVCPADAALLARARRRPVLHATPFSGTPCAWCQRSGASGLHVRPVV